MRLTNNSLSPTGSRVLTFQGKTGPKESLAVNLDTFASENPGVPLEGQDSAKFSGALTGFLGRMAGGKEAGALAGAMTEDLAMGKANGEAEEVTKHRSDVNAAKFALASSILEDGKVEPGEFEELRDGVADYYQKPELGKSEQFINDVRSLRIEESPQGTLTIF